VFDVTINDQPAARGVDPFALAGGMSEPAFVDTKPIKVTGGILELGFHRTGEEQQPLICGLEVFRTDK